MDSPGDAEKRIADLERELAQQRRINELEHELEEARGEPHPPGAAAGANVGDLLGTLSRLGFGAAGWPPSAASSRGAPADSRLSAAPRRVPLRFMVAELLPFRWWYIAAMFLIAIPAATLITTPAATLPVAVLTLLGIYTWQLIGTRTRLKLLKWGQVATVTGTEIASRASYYGGTTWYNAPLPVANGWRVTRPLWSGPSTKTNIRYTLDDHQGELSVRGREYLDGVILADQRHPDRAKCVTFFPYDLDRDDSGNWIGHLRARLVVGMVFWLLFILGWLTAAAAISTGYATRAMQHAQLITIDAGASGRVAGNSLTRTVSCNDGGTLTVDGNENTVIVTGHCAGLTVNGIRNTVTIESVDTISVDGIGSHITYHTGHPSISNTGLNTSASHG